MDEFTAYVSIAEATVYGARARVLDDLNALTNGEAEKAIKYVEEFKDLDRICNDIKEKKEKQKALEE